MRTNICPSDHKHGETPTCYRNHKCACFECRDANRVRCYERQKLIAYGRPTGTLTDAAPAQRHIGELVMAGMTPAAIAAASGVHLSTIRVIMRGRVSRKRPDTNRMFAATAAKILAVVPDLTAVPGHHRVDARGARRRVQALVAEGWGIEYLARRLNVGRHTLDRVLTSALVFNTVHIAVVELFEELAGQRPPLNTSAQRARHTLALQRARAEGWVPALAWDDIDNDDEPAVVPDNPALVDEVAVELALQGHDVDLSPLERQIVLERAPEIGLSAAKLAPILGISSRHVTRLRAPSRAA